MKRKKRFVLYFTVFLTLLILFTFNIASAEKQEEGKGYLWGNSPYEQVSDWYRVLVKASNYYALDNGNKVINLNPNMNVDTQIRDLHYMLAQGIDGILMAPTSATGLVSTIDEIVAKGIPVVTYDADAKTPKVLINIRVSNKKIGELAAAEMIKAAKKDGAEIKGKVLLISGSTTNIAAVERRDGALEVLKKYPSLEPVVYMIEGWSQADSTKTVVNAVSAWGAPFGIVACNSYVGIGAIEGLKSSNSAIPRGQKGHVYVGVVDVEKPMKDYMHQGLCDVGIDQPQLFYPTLAQYFLQKYLQEGEKAIPPVGVTVISDPDKPDGPLPDGKWNIYLKGNEHDGVNIFKYPTWAPAPVVENFGHRWLQVRPTVVLPENCDTLPIWSNVVDKWLR